jgi:hypothetical protein
MTALCMAGKCDAFVVALPLLTRGVGAVHSISCGSSHIHPHADSVFLTPEAGIVMQDHVQQGERYQA